MRKSPCPAIPVAELPFTVGFMAGPSMRIFIALNPPASPKKVRERQFLRSDQRIILYFKAGSIISRNIILPFFLSAACVTEGGTRTVMRACHGRRSCVLSTSPELFIRPMVSNPCKHPNTKPYLYVVYTCGKQLLFYFSVLNGLHSVVKGSCVPWCMKNIYTSTFEAPLLAVRN